LGRGPGADKNFYKRSKSGTRDSERKDHKRKTLGTNKRHRGTGYKSNEGDEDNERTASRARSSGSFGRHKSVEKLGKKGKRCGGREKLQLPQQLSMISSNELRQLEQKGRPMGFDRNTTNVREAEDRGVTV